MSDKPKSRWDRIGDGLQAIELVRIALWLMGSSILSFFAQKLTGAPWLVQTTFVLLCLTLLVFLLIGLLWLVDWHKAKRAFATTAAPPPTQDDAKPSGPSAMERRIERAQQALIDQAEQAKGVGNAGEFNAWMVATSTLAVNLLIGNLASRFARITSSSSGSLPLTTAERSHLGERAALLKAIALNLKPEHLRD